MTRFYPISVCATSAPLFTITDIFVGQLVAQMRHFKLRFGFLSTYRGTVFVKRTADYAFHVSRPIGDQDTNLSVRQCFAAFCILAGQAHGYTEDPGFQAQRVSSIQSVSVCIR